MSDLQDALDRLKAWGHSPDKLTPQVVADIFTGLEAARLVANLRQIVDEQAEDEGLWFVATTAPEAYLQQELRRLHVAIEGAAADVCETCGGDGRELDDMAAAALARAIGVEEVVNDACPDCDGTGVTPGDTETNMEELQGALYKAEELKRFANADTYGWVVDIAIVEHARLVANPNLKAMGKVNYALSHNDYSEAELQSLFAAALTPRTTHKQGDTDPGFPSYDGMNT